MARIPAPGSALTPLSILPVADTAGLIVVIATLAECEAAMIGILKRYEQKTQGAEIIELWNSTMALDWRLLRSDMLPDPLPPASQAVIENKLRAYGMYFTADGTAISWAPAPARPPLACGRCDVATPFVAADGTAYALRARLYS
jgi:hypothetical protein